MDLFEHLPAYRIIVCVTCQYAVPPLSLKSHLHTRHKTHPGLDAPSQRDGLVQLLQRLDLLNPIKDRPLVPDPRSDAIPCLPVFRGFACLAFTARLEPTMVKHHKETHPAGCKRGRPSAQTALVPRPQRWIQTNCQRFFGTGPQGIYFRVGEKLETEVKHPKAQWSKGTEEGPIGYEVAEQVLALSALRKQVARNAADIVYDNASKPEVSPWLEMTRWLRYLHGQSMTRLVPLCTSSRPPIRAVARAVCCEPEPAGLAGTQFD